MHIRRLRLATGRGFCGTRSQPGTTLDLASLELGINTDALVQRKLGDLYVDASIPSHRDHLHQFHTGSPIGDAHYAPVRRAAVVKIMVAPAQADDCPNAVPAKYPGPEVESRLHP